MAGAMADGDDGCKGQMRMAVVTLRFELNLHMVKGVIVCQVWLIWKIGGSGNGQYDFNGQNNHKLLTWKKVRETCRWQVRKGGAHCA